MLNLNFKDIFRYLMSLAPLFITCFLLMASVLNQDVKGLVYLGGILMVAILTIGFKQIIKLRPPETYVADTCQVFNLPPLISDYSAPDFNSMFLSFTLMYLIMPMAYGATPVNAIFIIITREKQSSTLPKSFCPTDRILTDSSRRSTTFI